MSGVDFKQSWADSANELYLSVNFLGTTVVIAPHPDDESLGCGGIIALLKKEGRSVKIVFVSDGSMSHPNSKKYPASLLMQLREKEALTAVKILGVPKKDCFFMRLKDGAVPHEMDKNFDNAVSVMNNILTSINADAILLPWKHDPHTDHQACWKIINKSLLDLETPVQLYHYLIWFWERGTPDLEIRNAVDWFKIDISTVIPLKLKAINAHQSQVSKMIDDDENGFILSPGVISHFEDQYELFATFKNQEKA